MSLLSTSQDLLIKPPYSNYLGGNTALYESATIDQPRMTGGSRRPNRISKRYRNTRVKKQTIHKKRGQNRSVARHAKNTRRHNLLRR